MNFQHALDYLLSLGHETLTLKLGLRNTELLLERLGNPQRSYESVQIAGTNGKGSTAVVLESICLNAGISTGLYTSPHLISIVERIVIDGHQIPEPDFANYASQVKDAAEDLLGKGDLQALPTFFEHVTAIALLAFKEAGVRLAILETGLGGRLDATTVAGAQTVAITPLALDHQEYLGETLGAIASEKAAIIRPGVTSAVIAAQPTEALAVIRQRSIDCNVDTGLDDCRTVVESVTDDGRFYVTFETPEDRYEHVLLGLRGGHQVINVAVALRLAESLRKRGFAISKTAITRGIERAQHAGRLELHPGQPSFLFDGAHNPAAARALREYLDEFVTAPLTLVFGAMNDKRLEEMAAILFPAAHQVILTRPDNPRAAAVEQLHRLGLKSAPPQKIKVVPSVSNALSIARDVTPHHGVVCVTGSLYLVGEAKALSHHAMTIGAS